MLPVTRVRPAFLRPAIPIRKPWGAWFKIVLLVLCCHSAVLRAETDGETLAGASASAGLQLAQEQPDLPASRITPECARTLNPMAFADPDGFERFIRGCYLRVIRIQIVTIGWISPLPNPFYGSSLNPISIAGGQIGGLLGAALQPDWIPKVYMGLVATANDPPPVTMTALQTYRNSRQYRSMLGARIELFLNPQTGEPMVARVKDPIVDGGWTPAFNMNKFMVTYAAWVPYIDQFSPSMKALRDSETHAGEKSSLSAVVVGRHPNSILNIPPGEQVLVDGLIRFRAGAVTDSVGVTIGSPNHVPWVWNEFAITSGGGKINVYGVASSFPTTWWYVDGQRIACQPRLADQSWPLQSLRPLSITINTAALRVYPALITGAPAANGAPQVADNVPVGPIYPQPYTVGPPSVGGNGQWRWVLGTSPAAAPAVSACGSGGS